MQVHGRQVLQGGLGQPGEQGRGRVRRGPRLAEDPFRSVEQLQVEHGELNKTIEQGNH